MLHYKCRIRLNLQSKQETPEKRRLRNSHSDLATFTDIRKYCQGLGQKAIPLKWRIFYAVRFQHYMFPENEYAFLRIYVYAFFS